MNHLIQVGKNPTIHVWEVESLKTLSILKDEHRRGVCACDFSGDFDKIMEILYFNGFRFVNSILSFLLTLLLLVIFKLLLLYTYCYIFFYNIQVIIIYSFLFYLQLTNGR